MKKRISIILSVILAIMSVLAVSSCSPEQEPPPAPKLKCSVRYLTGKNGYIEGEDYQEVLQGEDATPVTAVANDGCRFVKWSDGLTTSERHDVNITTSVKYTAIFEVIPKPIPKTFELKYVGKSDSKMRKVVFYKEDFQKVKFPVLTREAPFTFEGWYMGDTQIADGEGNMTIGEEIFDLDGNYITDKWTANETYSYKILLVYFNEVRIIGEYADTGEPYDKTYIMTDTEREFYRATAKKLKTEMGEMLDGLVDFQVDEYYTTQPITITDPTKYGLKLNNVEEVRDILGEYGSAVSVSNIHEYAYDRKERYVKGQAFAHICEVFADEIYDTGEKAILSEDLNHKDWDRFMRVIIHEIAHTIECAYDLTSFHEATTSYSDHGKAYYLNEDRGYLHDREPIGIYYGFWKGEIYNVEYKKSGSTKAFLFGHDFNGYSNWLNKTKRLYGGKVKMEAVPLEGVRFLGWSDGVTTPERTDVITGDFTVTAIFEEIE